MSGYAIKNQSFFMWCLSVVLIPLVLLATICASATDKQAQSFDLEETLHSSLSENSSSDAQEIAANRDTGGSISTSNEASSDQNTNMGKEKRASNNENTNTEGSACDIPPQEGEEIILLDLIQAQRRALEENPSLAAGAERLAAAKLLVTRARSLYFPQIDVSYTYTFTWLPTGYTDSINDNLDQIEDVVTSIRRTIYTTYATNPSSFSISDRRTIRSYLNMVDENLETARKNLESPRETTTANLTAAWLLFDGFAREFANAMARNGYGEAQAAYKDGQRILLDAVAQAYYGGQYAREQIAIAESAIAFFTRLYEEAVARRKIGRGSTSDVLNFETALYAAKGNLLRAKREYEMARIALAVLMGVKEGYLPDSIQFATLETETPETMTLPDAGAMVALAMECRPDLQQRELGVKRAKASVKREYARFTPQIAAVASVATTNVSDVGISRERLTTTVGINASMTLFSGGRRKADLLEAKYAQRESEWRLVEAERKIAGEVRQALHDLKVAQEALVLQRNAASCVEKNRDLVEKEYRAGKAMLVRLNQAQNDYVQAMGLLAQARVNLQRSWQALHHATGVSLALLTGDLPPVFATLQPVTSSQETENEEKNHE